MTVTDWISALAAVGNLVLLGWLIRVTIRYVDVNQGLLETNRESLEELKRQHRELVEREKLPFRNLIERSIKKLEEFEARDLVAAYESPNLSNRPRTDDLLPTDFHSVVEKLKEYDVALHELLEKVELQAVETSKQKLGEMERVALSEQQPSSPKLTQLQEEFRAAVAPVLEELRRAEQMLDEKGAPSF